MLMPPNCYLRKCKHFQGVKQDDSDESGDCNVCAAYPDGIPDAIAYGDNPHTDPYPGDHGITYEKEKANG